MEEHKAIARERDERKKKLDELQITLKKDLYMAKVGQCSILPDGTAQPSDEARIREKRP